MTLDWIVKSLNVAIESVPQIIETGLKVVENKIEEIDANIKEMASAETESEGNSSVETSDYENTQESINFPEYLVITDSTLKLVDQIVSDRKSFLSHDIGNDKAPFKMSAYQRGHALKILGMSPALASFRYDSAPSLISEDNFWRVYFTLLKQKHKELNNAAESNKNTLYFQRKPELPVDRKEWRNEKPTETKKTKKSSSRQAKDKKGKQRKGEEEDDFEIVSNTRASIEEEEEAYVTDFTLV